VSRGRVTTCRPVHAVPAGDGGLPVLPGRAADDAIAVRRSPASSTASDRGRADHWVLSFPTRRYFAAVRYTGAARGDRAQRRQRRQHLLHPRTTPSWAQRQRRQGYQICTKLGANAVAFYDREEAGQITEDIVISPGTRPVLDLRRGGGAGHQRLLGGQLGDLRLGGTGQRHQRFKEGWGYLRVPSGERPADAGAAVHPREQHPDQRYYGMSYPPASSCGLPRAVPAKSVTHQRR